MAKKKLLRDYQLEWKMWSPTMTREKLSVQQTIQPQPSPYEYSIWANYTNCTKGYLKPSLSLEDKSALPPSFGYRREVLSHQICFFVDHVLVNRPYL